jgi:hypothetical protein
MALTSMALPAELRSSGLALLTTVTTLTRFGAALGFGLMWTWQGPDAAVGVFLAGLVVALPVAVGILFSNRQAVAA